MNLRSPQMARSDLISADEKYVYMLSGWRLMMISIDTGNFWSDSLGRGGENEFAITADGKIRSDQRRRKIRLHAVRLAPDDDLHRHRQFLVGQPRTRR